MKKALAAGLFLTTLMAFAAWSVWNQPRTDAEVPAFAGGRVIWEPRHNASGMLFREPISGVVAPAIVAARDASVPSQAAVVGVVVDGQARAYLLDALATPESHLVHDTIAGKPIAVTFCDSTGYARCLRAPPDTAATDLKLAGFMKDELHFAYCGKYYAHDSLDVPFDDLEFTSTNWETRRSMYPQTNLYTGVQ